MEGLRGRGGLTDIRVSFWLQRSKGGSEGLLKRQASRRERDDGDVNGGSWGREGEEWICFGGGAQQALLAHWLSAAQPWARWQAGGRGACSSCLGQSPSVPLHQRDGRLRGVETQAEAEGPRPSRRLLLSRARAGPEPTGCEGGPTKSQR